MRPPPPWALAAVRANAWRRGDGEWDPPMEPVPHSGYPVRVCWICARVAITRGPPALDVPIDMYVCEMHLGLQSLDASFRDLLDAWRFDARRGFGFHDTRAEAPQEPPWMVDLACKTAVEQNLRVVRFAVSALNDTTTETFVEIHAAYDQWLVQLLRDAGFVHHASVDVWLYRAIGEES